MKGSKTGGRKKGTPNKVTVTLKEAAMGALNAGDGAEVFFIELKKENPVAFSQFLKVILPAEIKVDSQISGELVVRWEE